MPDFTVYRHPALAVPCPSCGTDPGLWCCHPNAQFTGTLHRARQAEADRQFIERYGHEAAIIHAASGWLIDPHGCARD